MLIEGLCEKKRQKQKKKNKQKKQNKKRLLLKIQIAPKEHMYFGT